jgi:hypothetical protein
VVMLIMMECSGCSHYVIYKKKKLIILHISSKLLFGNYDNRSVMSSRCLFFPEKISSFKEYLVVLILEQGNSF